jgi:hypothetical protein
MGTNGDGKTGGSLQKIAKELTGVKLPDVLSSYMTGDNLPQEYAFIKEYVSEVRRRMVIDAGGRLNQLQTLVLDGICDVLVILKYVSTFIGENPGDRVVTFNKFGVPQMSDVALRGFSGLHQVLDKKIKQFHELTIVQAQRDEDDGYLGAVMGDVKPIKTGRPQGSKH